MADFQSLTLQNFKGAEDVAIDISKKIDTPVITLIGLNESGKTTILEGMSYFVSGDNAVSGLFQRVHQRSDIAALIPIHKKAAFTDTIRVSAIVTLDRGDFETAQDIAKAHNRELEKATFPNAIEVAREYVFEDSVLMESNNIWDCDIRARVRSSKKAREFKALSDTSQLWEEIVEELEGRLPRIAYFPTFLVDMPNRIYLQEHENERPVNRYYRTVFQDILDSLDEGLSLDKHVNKRIKDYQEKETSANWLSSLLGSSNRAPIDSVFQKMSNAVTKNVLGSWRKVFQRSISARSISIDWGVDTEKGNLPYASFAVSDGESRYAISERSLGFRWFFSFLLFTNFKQVSENQMLFIFDEPAANLHAKAQAELLKSFARIVGDGHRIIYSTHSHHMINPRWLSGAYIVENAALDYDSDDAFELNTSPTNIRATRYREFVAQYPTRTSYFQPVLEKLEYVPPDILGSEPFVILEGISDYHALSLASRIKGVRLGFTLVPGSGSGSSGPLISLLLGRGERFLLLLDDDKSGRDAAQRYRDGWYLETDSTPTLAELLPSLKNHKLEKLISDDTLSKIKDRFDIIGSPSKKQIGIYLAEAHAAEPIGDPFGKETLATLVRVLDALGERLKSSKPAKKARTRKSGRNH